MFMSYKIVLNELDETVKDSLRKTPKEHIFVAHLWAERKVKSKIPDHIKNLIKGV